MSDLINASICVTDIPKSKIKLAENGKKYMNITIATRREPDNYESNQRRTGSGNGTHLHWQWKRIRFYTGCNDSGKRRPNASSIRHGRSAFLNHDLRPE